MNLRSEKYGYRGSNILILAAYVNHHPKYSDAARTKLGVFSHGIYNTR